MIGDQYLISLRLLLGYSLYNVSLPVEWSSRFYLFRAFIILIIACSSSWVKGTVSGDIYFGLCVEKNSVQDSFWLLPARYLDRWKFDSAICSSSFDITKPQQEAIGADWWISSRWVLFGKNFKLHQSCGDKDWRFGLKVRNKTFGRNHKWWRKRQNKSAFDLQRQGCPYQGKWTEVILE